MGSSCVLSAQTETDFMGKLTETGKKMDVALLKGTVMTHCGRLGFRRMFCGILMSVLPCKTRSSLPLPRSTGASSAAAGARGCSQPARLRAVPCPLHPRTLRLRRCCRYTPGQSVKPPLQQIYLLFQRLEIWEFRLRVP